MKEFCRICGEKNTYMTSETSSCYTYCEKCGNNKETALKQSLFDSILKSINNYFKKFDITFIDNLKIDIVYSNNFIVTKINGIVLNKKECYFKLSNKDEYFFKNCVTYIIEDTLFIDGDKIKLNVDFAS